MSICLKTEPTFLEPGAEPKAEDNMEEKVIKARTYLAHIAVQLMRWRLTGYEAAVKEAAKAGKKISLMHVNNTKWNVVKGHPDISMMLAAAVLQKFGLKPVSRTGFLHTEHLCIEWGWVHVEGHPDLIVDLVPQSTNYHAIPILGKLVQLNPKVMVEGVGDVDILALLGVPTMTGDPQYLDEPLPNCIEGKMPSNPSERLLIRMPPEMKEHYAHLVEQIAAGAVEECEDLWELCSVQRKIMTLVQKDLGKVEASEREPAEDEGEDE